MSAAHWGITSVKKQSVLIRFHECCLVNVWFGLRLTVNQAAVCFWRRSSTLMAAAVQQQQTSEPFEPRTEAFMEIQIDFSDIQSPNKWMLLALEICQARIKNFKRTHGLSFSFHLCQILSNVKTAQLSDVPVTSWSCSENYQEYNKTQADGQNYQPQRDLVLLALAFCAGVCAVL